MPGIENFKESIDVSWTITFQKDRDISPELYDSVKGIIDKYFHVGIACTERGVKMGNLHIQATGSLYFTHDSKLLTWLSNQFREIMKNETRSTDIKHQFKMFGEKQNLSSMIGYCLKSSKQKDFQMYVKNINKDDIIKAQLQYQTLSTDPSEGKLLLVKKNLMKHCYGYYVHNIFPQIVSFSETISQMLNTDYFLDSSFFIAPFLEIDRYEKYWKHICLKCGLSSKDVEKILFSTRKVCF